MPNLHELENAMPVAPLKIIALPSAEKMGRRINDYMVEFRKSIHNDKVKNDPAFHGYIESNYLVDVDVPRFGSGKPKRTSARPSAVRICSFSPMYAIIVLLTT